MPASGTRGHGLLHAYQEVKRPLSRQDGHRVREAAYTEGVRARKEAADRSEPGCGTE